MASLLTGTLERTVGWFHPGTRRTADETEIAPSIERTPARPLDLRIRQWLCRARCGHDFILGVDRKRLYLICQSCFHETRGWELTERPPRAVN
jgi:hypothetical protein